MPGTIKITCGNVNGRFTCGRSSSSSSSGRSSVSGAGFRGGRMSGCSGGSGSSSGKSSSSGSGSRPLSTNVNQPSIGSFGPVLREYTAADCHYNCEYNKKYDTHMTCGGISTPIEILGGNIDTAECIEKTKAEKRECVNQCKREFKVNKPLDLFDKHKANGSKPECKSEFKVNEPLGLLFES